MTLFIPQVVKDKVEDWLSRVHRGNEHGGLFFGEGSKVRMCLPLPNIDEQKSKCYLWDRGLLPFFEKFIGMPVIADWHTHPSGGVPSEGDLEYCRTRNWPFHIVIADQGEDGFFWQPLTTANGGKGKEGMPVKLVIEDNVMEDTWLALAESTGLMDLGHVFMTPHGELLYDHSSAPEVLRLDEDAFRVWQFLKKRETSYTSWSEVIYRYGIKAEMSKELGLSMYHINQTLKRLGIS